MDTFGVILYKYNVWHRQVIEPKELRQVEDVCFKPNTHGCEEQCHVTGFEHENQGQQLHDHQG